jgi:hypothetical protein
MVFTALILPGIVALLLFDIGVVVKLLSETVDEVDTGPIEAARAGGSSRTQTVRWAVLPQVLPNYVAFALYAFELNVRASTVIGVVGAGVLGPALAVPLLRVEQCLGHRHRALRHRPRHRAHLHPTATAAGMTRDTRAADTGSRSARPIPPSHLRRNLWLAGGAALVLWAAIAVNVDLADRWPCRGRVWRLRDVPGGRS